MSDALTLELQRGRARARVRSRRRDAEPPAEIEIPIGLLAEITHRCPLQCPYCSNPVALERPRRRAAGSGMGAGLRRGGGARRSCSCTSPAASRWRGRDVAEIVRGARAAGLYVNLITAAVGMTPERADALVEAGVEHVQISLQDATAEGCNRITNYKGFREEARGGAARHRARPAADHQRRRPPAEPRPRRGDDRARRAARRAPAGDRHTQYYGWALQNRAALMPEPHQVEAATAVVKAARERLSGRMLIDYVVARLLRRQIPKALHGRLGTAVPRGHALRPSCAALPCGGRRIPGLALRQSCASRASAGSGGAPTPSTASAARTGCRSPAAAATRRARISAAAAARPCMLTGERRGDRSGLPPLAASCRAAHDHRRHLCRPRAGLRLSALLRSIAALGSTRISGLAASRCKVAGRGETSSPTVRHSNKR